MILRKPKLYVHVGQAKHFFRWEEPEFRQHFELMEMPSRQYSLLSFGPDVLEEAAQLPALARFAVVFPGFAHNPLHNPVTRQHHRTTITDHYRLAFINPGPLELAYKGLENVFVFPISVDTSIGGSVGLRSELRTLLHASSDTPQKDRERNVEIMRRTGLNYEIFPPRRAKSLTRLTRGGRTVGNIARQVFGRPKRHYSPLGYVSHHDMLEKYRAHDGFVHVARDVMHPFYIDGKYTATFIEAGLTGAILFWHDTFGLGNDFETVFSLPLDPSEAAREILRIRSSIDVRAHSRRTREELIDAVSPTRSVAVRVRAMLDRLDGG